MCKKLNSYQLLKGKWTTLFASEVLYLQKLPTRYDLALAKLGKRISFVENKNLPNDHVSAYPWFYPSEVNIFIFDLESSFAGNSKSSWSHSGQTLPPKSLKFVLSASKRDATFQFRKENLIFIANFNLEE